MLRAFSLLKNVFLDFPGINDMSGKNRTEKIDCPLQDSLSFDSEFCGNQSEKNKAQTAVWPFALSRMEFFAFVVASA